MKSNNYFKLFSFLVSLSFLFSSCEVEEFDSSSNIPLESSFQTEDGNPINVTSFEVVLSEHTQLSDFLENRFSQSLQKSAIDAPFGSIQLSGIEGLIDSLGQKTYTAAIIPTKLYESRFFNYILVTDSLDNTIQDYIIEYAMATEFQELYTTNEVNLGAFSGFVRTYKASDFMLTQKNTGDCVEPLITQPVNDSSSCIEDEVNDGEIDDTNSNPDDPIDGNSGGNDSDDGQGPDGGDTTGNPNGGDESDGCPKGLFIKGCGGTNSDYWHPYPSCGGPDKDSPQAQTAYFFDCTSNDKSASCGSPLMTSIVEIEYEKLEQKLGLTDAEVTRLNNNCELKGDIYTFVNQNEIIFNDPEVAFANTVIDLLADDGSMDFEVDFEEQIIKDSSFIGTSIECVLDNLMENSIWQEASEAFNPIDSEYSIKFTTYNNPNDTANARTALPDSNDIIEIKFNLGNISPGSLEIANDILHETFHAELHRIHFSNNAEPNSLTQEQFAWFEQLWDFYTNENENYTAADSEHVYMSQYLITPIANGLREFDNLSQLLDSYKHLAWFGLSDFGVSADYITQSELDDLADLYNNVLNDNNEPPCN